VLLRVTRSPFGHVLVAIRENQLRATFQGYPVDRYKLGVFVLSAVIAGVAGALLGFQTYLVSAEAVSVPFSGELLAMVVIGGMHHVLGPALGALFFIVFRELFSIWTANWLLWFGLVFVGFVLFLAQRADWHLGQAAATLASSTGRSRGDEQTQDL
jgi:ABC-type branched-subunit amino acid transport system permease subunit